MSVHWEDWFSSSGRGLVQGGLLWGGGEESAGCGGQSRLQHGSAVQEKVLQAGGG